MFDQVLATVVGSGADPSLQAADAVAEVHPAIEVVEKRYPDLAALGTPTLIADQVFMAICMANIFSVSERFA